MSLRLVLNGRFLGRPVTGVERFSLELVRAMRTILTELGAADIDVLVPHGAALTDEQIAGLGNPGPTITRVGRLGGHQWEQRELAAIRPEAWLLDLCNTGPMLRRRQALVIHDAQIILHPEAYSRAFRWWYRPMQTLASRRARAVFTVSEFAKATLEAHRLVPRGKAHVLRSGVDHLKAVPRDDTILERNGLAPESYVLAIGSLARHKNLPLLIDSFLEAALPGISLVVAGGGNLRVFQAAGMRQASSIHYIGRVSDSELKALYAGALAFACPSISEGFGLTPMEAMTTGCAVLATTGGAVPEICGDAALYADPHDRAAWREGLRRITSDVALRERLRGNAVARSNLFVWRNTAGQVLETLAGLDGDAELQSSLKALFAIA